MRYTSPPRRFPAPLPSGTRSTQLPQVHQPCLGEQIACFRMYMESGYGESSWDEVPSSDKKKVSNKKSSMLRHSSALRTSQAPRKAPHEPSTTSAGFRPGPQILPGFLLTAPNPFLCMKKRKKESPAQTQAFADVFLATQSALTASVICIQGIGSSPFQHGKEIN